MIQSNAGWTSAYAPSVSLKRTISEVTPEDYSHLWSFKRLSSADDQRVPCTPPSSASYMSPVSPLHHPYLTRNDSVASACSDDSFCSLDADDTTPTNEGVKDFLDQMDLGKYWTSFKTRGFDREDDIINLTEEDLDVLDITCDSDRHLILQAGKMTPLYRNTFQYC